MQGITDEGEVVFSFADSTTGVQTSFGVNLKKYFGQVYSTDELNSMGRYLHECKDCLNERHPEGAYTFIPDKKDPLPKSFGKVDDEVLYQKGMFIEQWTINFKGDTGAGMEKGLIKVRNSPWFRGLIEFEVELEAIPIDDDKSKDVIVNWKFYNGFDPKGSFYTDSNALEMQSRQKVFLRLEDEQESNEVQNVTPNQFTISGNYYPVDSAIAMRDKSGHSNYQVTIMNDRPQAGSADLSDSATIELMQNRRSVYDDALGLMEPLNDTDWEIGSNKATNRYWMQIFDHKKSESLQRIT